VPLVVAGQQAAQHPFQAATTYVGQAAVPPATPRSFPNALELFNSLKRRWVLAGLVGGLVSAVGAIAVWMALPAGKHQARATIRYKQSEMPGVTSEAFERDKEDLVSMAQTRPFLAQVINSNPEVARQPIIQQSPDKTLVYEDSIRLRWRSPEYMTAIMNGDDVNQLKVLLSAFAHDLVSQKKVEDERKFRDELVNHRRTIEECDNQITLINKELDQLERQGGGGSTVETRQSIRKQMTDDISRAAEKLNEVRNQEQVVNFELSQIDAELTARTITIDTDAVNRTVELDPRVISQNGKFQTAKEDLEILRKSLKEGHPRLTEDTNILAGIPSKLAGVRDEIKKTLIPQEEAKRKGELNRERQGLERKSKGLALQRETAEKIKKQTEDKLADFDRGNNSTRPKNTDLQHYSDLRSKTLVQKSNVETAIRNSASRIELKEDAEVIPNFNLKQKMLFSIAAGVILLFGVVGLIGLLEWRNRRVDGVDQVVSELGMRVIGTIPAFPSRASLKSGEASQNQNWRFILNESVNSTRTMLLHAAKTQRMQVLMVTSAMQGEGKTSLSSQLATSMATAGLRTLILDCDLRNPSLQKLFDVPVAPGCSEILLQEIDISDAVQPTSVPNLWIIPAGQCNHRVVAALAQGHPLEALFNRLRGQFDFIVVDSCPILPVADTLLVAQYVDGVVFSILQDVSQLPKVQSASDRLAQLNIPLLGAVVNGIKPDIQAYGYNYVKQLPA